MDRGAAGGSNYAFLRCGPVDARRAPQMISGQVRPIVNVVGATGTNTAGPGAGDGGGGGGEGGEGAVQPAFAVVQPLVTCVLMLPEKLLQFTV